MVSFSDLFSKKWQSFLRGRDTSDEHRGSGQNSVSDRGCCSQTASLRFLLQFQYGCHHWNQTFAYVAVCVLLKGAFPSHVQILTWCLVYMCALNYIYV